MSVEEALQAVDEELAKRGYRMQRMTGYPVPSWALLRPDERLKPLEELSTEELVDGQRVSGAIELERREHLEDPRCQDELDVLQNRFPQVNGVMTVEGSFVEPLLRDQGLGRLMYEHALLDVAKRGYAIAPHSCVMGSTSHEARRVWTSLKRDYEYQGSVVTGMPKKRRVPGRRPTPGRRPA